MMAPVPREVLWVQVLEGADLHRLSQGPLKLYLLVTVLDMRLSLLSLLVVGVAEVVRALFELVGTRQVQVVRTLPLRVVNRKRVGRARGQGHLERFAVLP